MRNARSQVARRVDRVPGCSSEREPDAPDETPDEIGAEAGGRSGRRDGLREDRANDKDEHKRPNHFTHQIRDELTDCGRGAETGAFESAIRSRLPMGQIVEPHERRAGDRSEELRDEIGSEFREVAGARRESSVTAGFKCASLLPHAIDVNTPAITANAQPAVMTIHPLPSAFVPLSSTPATTPLPRRIRTIVPRNSPSSGDVMGCSEAALEVPDCP